MSIPKEPRQQMINMMYLVLTALLALNVSAEILKAFELVNDGINKTITSIENKNNFVYSALDEQMKINAEKTRQYHKNAQRAKIISKRLYDEIEEIKQDIIVKSGGVDEETGRLEGAKNLDIPSQVMLTQGGGKELQKKINNAREEFLDLIANVEPGMRSNYEKRITLNAENPENDPENRDWAAFHFQMMPVIAAQVLFTKFQNDVKTAEAEVIDFMLNQIGAEDFKVDVLQAKVIAPTSYVTLGQEYEADIFVSAHSSTQHPDVYLGKLDTSIAKQDTASGGFQEITGDLLGDRSTPLLEITDTLEVHYGMGRMQVKTSNTGVIDYEGAIRVQKPTGEYAWYPFKNKYQVAEGAVVVSPDKMNVMYIGVDNPLSISVPGFAADKIRPSISQGSIRPAPGEGKYVGRVTSSGEAIISVSVELPSGEMERMGAKDFRVKRVPDPVPKVGNLKSGKVPTGSFKAQRGVIADLESFEFDLKFNVVGFNITYLPKRDDALTASTKGPVFSDRMKQFLQRAKPGDKFFLDDIKVRGPDGVTRTLSSIAYDLQ